MGVFGFHLFVKACCVMLVDSDHGVGVAVPEKPCLPIGREAKLALLRIQDPSYRARRRAMNSPHIGQAAAHAVTHSCQMLGCMAGSARDINVEERRV